MAINNPTLQQSAQLKGTVTRKDGQLFEEPSSPFGAKSIGATPDQAKMAGVKQPQPVTPIQRTKPSAPPQPTLQPKDVGEEQKAQIAGTQQKVEKLSQLGGFNERVGSIVQRRIKDIASAPVQVQAAVDILDKTVDPNLPIVVNGQAMSLQDAAAQWASNPGDESAVIAIMNTINAGKPKDQQIDANTVKSWISTSDRALGDVAQQAFASDQITLADLSEQDVTDMGFASMSEMNQQIGDIFGIAPEQVTNLTLGEIRDEIEEARQEMFGELTALRQELTNVPPGSAAAQQIQARIEDLTGAGLVAAEQDFQALAQDLATDVDVTIGNTTMSIEDALSNQRISDLAVEWLNAETQEERDRILPPEQFGDFTQWLTDNQQVMREIANQLSAEVSEIAETEAATRTLQNLDQDLLTKIAGQTGIDLNLDQALTQDEAQKRDEALKKSGIFQVLSPDFAPDWLSEDERMDLASIINADNFDQYKDLNVQQLVNGRRFAREIQNNPELQAFMGGTPELLTNIDDVRKLQRAKQTLGQLEKSGLSTDFSENPEFQNLVTSGKFDSSIIKQFGGKTDPDGNPLLTNPEVSKYVAEHNIPRSDLWKTLHKSEKALAKKTLDDDIRRYDPAASVDENLQAILPGSPTALQLQETYQELQDRLAVGDPEAKSLIKQFKQWDVNNDGLIDETEIDSVLQKFEPAEFADYMEGNVPDVKVPNTTIPDPSNTVFTKAIKMVNQDDDGRLELDQLRKLGNLDKLDPDWLLAHAPSNYNTVDDIRVRLRSDDLKEPDSQFAQMAGKELAVFRKMWDKEPIDAYYALDKYEPLAQTYNKIYDHWKTISDPIERRAYWKLLEPLHKKLQEIYRHHEKLERDRLQNIMTDPHTGKAFIPGYSEKRKKIVPKDTSQPLTENPLPSPTTTQEYNPKKAKDIKDTPIGQVNLGIP